LLGLGSNTAYFSLFSFISLPLPLSYSGKSFIKFAPRWRQIVCKIKILFQQNNETHVEFDESDWARDVTYTHYYKVWSNLILTAVIPLIVLVPILSKKNFFSSSLALPKSTLGCFPLASFFQADLLLVSNTQLTLKEPFP
jgi:hypothetical protein